MARRTSRASSAQSFLPPSPTLPTLRAAAAECTGCGLYRDATQTVFGEGPARAAAVLVGEQPGDHEDRQGRPFVGPAGRLLDQALADAGMDRSEVYVTNAVKHFKWQLSGRRRLHKKPNRIEVRACRPWLTAEIALVQPRIVVCLGATAAQALLGPDFRITQHRGEMISHEDFPPVLVTVHPSSLLRIPDRDERELAYQAFVEELHEAVEYIRTRETARES